MSIFEEFLGLSVKKATTSVHPALLSIVTIAAMTRATPQKTLEAVLEYQQQHSVIILPFQILTAEDLETFALSIIKCAYPPSTLGTLKKYISTARSIQKLMSFVGKNEELHASALWAFRYFHGLDFKNLSSAYPGSGPPPPVIFLPDRSKDGA